MVVDARTFEWRKSCGGAERKGENALGIVILDGVICDCIAGDLSWGR